jgi:hypothetical protein
MNLFGITIIKKLYFERILIQELPYHLSKESKYSEIFMIYFLKAKYQLIK